MVITILPLQPGVKCFNHEFCIFLCDLIRACTHSIGRDLGSSWLNISDLGIGLKALSLSTVLNRDVTLWVTYLFCFFSTCTVRDIDIQTIVFAKSIQFRFAFDIMFIGLMAQRLYQLSFQFAVEDCFVSYKAIIAIGYTEVYSVRDFSDVVLLSGLWLNEVFLYLRPCNPLSGCWVQVWHSAGLAQGTEELYGIKTLSV